MSMNTVTQVQVIVTGTIQRFEINEHGTCRLSIPKNTKMADEAEHTVWYNATAFQGKAEWCIKNLRKGSVVQLILEPNYYYGEESIRQGWRLVSVNPLFNFGRRQEEPAMEPEEKAVPE